MRRQSHASSFQTLLPFLWRFVYLLPVSLWSVFVHLPPYNSIVEGLSRRPVFPTLPSLYISSYLTMAYPRQRYPLVCFSQVPATHPESFACYVPDDRGTSHTGHLLLVACVSLIGIPAVESPYHSLYRQICILQLYQLLGLLLIVFLAIDQHCLLLRRKKIAFNVPFQM